MQLRLPRTSRPVAACPRCVYRLRERQLRSGRCPNCDLPLRGPLPAAPSPLAENGSGTITVIERDGSPEWCEGDVFEALDFDPEDAGAQTWLARARREREADRAEIADLTRRIAELEQQVEDFILERGQLMALVDSVLRKTPQAAPHPPAHTGLSR